MSFRFRFRFFCLFPLLYPGVFSIHDILLERKAKEELDSAFLKRKENYLNEKERTSGLNLNVRAIEISSLESYEDDSSEYILRYRIPFVLKDGFPEIKVTFSIG